MSPLIVLIIAVLATTYAGPVVRLAAAPALAIAFWRLVLVLPVTGGLALREPRTLTRGAVGLMVISGLLLAAHFWTWIASLRFTSVASSVVAVGGAILIGAGDAALSFGHLTGDLLALAGALTAAGYYTIGRRVRATVGVWTYASIVYGVAALALGAFAATVHAPLLGHSGTDWAVMASLAAGPMLIGHTGMNYALKHFRATTVNVAALGEPVGATLIAWLVPAIGETPPVTAILGGAVVLVGIGLAFSDRGQGVAPDGGRRMADGARAR